MCSKVLDSIEACIDQLSFKSLIRFCFVQISVQEWLD